MRAVFLDRDGVLNRDTPGFITSAEMLEALPGAPDAVARLCRAGFTVAVVTNQSGVGRGIMTESDLASVHARLTSEIERAGGAFAAIYHCPHAPWELCECRKPLPGMLFRARDELGINLNRSYLVGDKPTDIECGAVAGCRTILVLSGLDPTYAPERFRIEPDHVCADITAAVTWVLDDSSKP